MSDTDNTIDNDIDIDTDTDTDIELIHQCGFTFTKPYINTFPFITYFYKQVE